MMREIKFRGKRLDNGEWVEGFYFESFTEIPYIMTLHDHILGMTEFYEVDPATVGQFTGLLDKNGKRIFEGDILKDTDNEIYYVDFIRGCFYLRTNYKSFPHLGWAEWLPMCEIDRLANPTEFEVIGNIYENPDSKGDK